MRVRDVAEDFAGHKSMCHREPNRKGLPTLDYGSLKQRIAQERSQAQGTRGWRLRTRRPEAQHDAEVGVLRHLLRQRKIARIESPYLTGVPR
jgi:hypothetical protein